MQKLCPDANGLTHITRLDPRHFVFLVSEWFNSQMGIAVKGRGSKMKMKETNFAKRRMRRIIALWILLEADTWKFAPVKLQTDFVASES